MLGMSISIFHKIVLVVENKDKHQLCICLDKLPVNDPSQSWVENENEAILKTFPNNSSKWCTVLQTDHYNTTESSPRKKVSGKTILKKAGECDRPLDIILSYL